MTTCKDCRYYDNTVQKPGTPAREETGLCRYNAPVASALPGWQWPFCRSTDWCGRFAEREA